MPGRKTTHPPLSPPGSQERWRRWRCVASTLVASLECCSSGIARGTNLLPLPHWSLPFPQGRVVGQCWACRICAAGGQRLPQLFLVCEFLLKTVPRHCCLTSCHSEALP